MDQYKTIEDRYIAQLWVHMTRFLGETDVNKAAYLLWMKISILMCCDFLFVGEHNMVGYVDIKKELKSIYYLNWFRFFHHLRMNPLKTMHKHFQTMTKWRALALPYLSSVLWMKEVVQSYRRYNFESLLMVNAMK